MSSTPSENFWDERIIRWEERRYSNKGNWFESSSVNYRLNKSREILSKRVAGKKVWELGCGSGLQAEAILNAGAKSYVGFDISTVAIAKANARHPNIRFEAKNATELFPQNCEFVFSLGLFDWLSLEEVNSIMTAFEGIPFLHGFSEYRPLSLTQSIHRIYSLWSYENHYRPRYHKANLLSGTVYRDPRLRFGIFLTSFEL